MKFMPLQRRDDEDLNPFSPHPGRHELHGEALAGATGPEDRHVRVFVNAGIKYVHDDERVVVLVDAQQNAVVVAHFVAGKGITARRAQRQDVPR